MCLHRGPKPREANRGEIAQSFSKVKNWGVHVVTDGLLITGQNPASSGPTAKVLINALKTK